MVVETLAWRMAVTGPDEIMTERRMDPLRERLSQRVSANFGRCTHGFNGGKSSFDRLSNQPSWKGVYRPKMADI